MAAETKHSNHAARSAYSSRNLWAGILFGLGLVAFIDETLFHQLLHWHHFYDKSTTDIGLVSDGLFHAFSWFATIGSSFMLADLNRRNAWWPARWWGGILLGGGGFQLYDGIIQHKLMRIHQIRYDVDILPYDLIWNILAAAMLAAGIVLAIRTRRESQQTGGTALNER
ncbi:putative membrane protein [Bacillus fengqiuensis]|nr:putative membrane protein [Bacillus fengqiuensis]